MHLKFGANFTAELAEGAEKRIIRVFFAGSAFSAVRIYSLPARFATYGQAETIVESWSDTPLALNASTSKVRPFPVGAL